MLDGLLYHESDLRIEEHYTDTAGFTAMDDQILALYARGMSTRDIVYMFQQMYGVEISAALVSKVTDAVIGEVRLPSLGHQLGRTQGTSGAVDD